MALKIRQKYQNGCYNHVYYCFATVYYGKPEATRDCNNHKLNHLGIFDEFLMLYIGPKSSKLKLLII
jgi:hypothetical protein